MDEEIFDVILQTTARFRTDILTFQEHRPPEQKFSLADETWVGRLPYDIHPDLVLNVCEPTGFNHRPTRQYGMRYAFCRRARPIETDYFKWDCDLTLTRVVFLSRLIWPTTIANAYSARLYFIDRELRRIVPGPTQGTGAHAWVVAKDTWRDWLSMADCEQLRDLWTKYEINASDRVRRSRQHLSHAFYSYYLDQRFASLVTSFESLLKTSHNDVTRQFALRVSTLAEMLGFAVDQADARVMYNDRSAFVHGGDSGFKELTDELIERYTRFERVLRKALLRASTEPEFAAHFQSAQSIEATFGK